MSNDPPVFLKMNIKAVYNCPHEYESKTYPYKKYMTNIRVTNELPYDFFDAPQHESVHDLGLRNKINPGEKVYQMDAVYMKPLDQPTNYAMAPFVGLKGKFLHLLGPTFRTNGEIEEFPIADAVFLGEKEYMSKEDFAMLLERPRALIHERMRKRVQRMNKAADDHKVQHQASVAVDEVQIFKSMSKGDLVLFDSMRQSNVMMMSDSLTPDAKLSDIMVTSSPMIE